MSGHRPASLPQIFAGVPPPDRRTFVLAQTIPYRPWHWAAVHDEAWSGVLVRSSDPKVSAEISREQVFAVGGGMRNPMDAVRLYVAVAVWGAGRFNVTRRLWVV